MNDRYWRHILKSLVDCRLIDDRIMTEANNAFIRVQGLDALIMPSLISIKSALREESRAMRRVSREKGLHNWGNSGGVRPKDRSNSATGGALRGTKERHGHVLYLRIRILR